MKQSVVILFVLHDLGDGPVTTEDIAVKRCPERFALPKHPEYPNIEAVRKRLQSEMGWVQGSQKRGWILTSAHPFVDARVTSQDMLLDVQRLENRLRGDEKLAGPLQTMKTAITEFSRQAADCRKEVGT